MKAQRGLTIIEMLAVAALVPIVASLVGSLYLMTTRTIETERARTELLAGAREIFRYLKRDVHSARSLTVAPEQLTIAGDERLRYVNVAGGVARQSGKGARILGAPGLKLSFRALGSRGVAVTLTGGRMVRSRAISLRRETVIARRRP